MSLALGMALGLPQISGGILSGIPNEPDPPEGETWWETHEFVLGRDANEEGFAAGGRYFLLNTGAVQERTAGSWNVSGLLINGRTYRLVATVRAVNHLDDTLYNAGSTVVQLRMGSDAELSNNDPGQSVTGIGGNRTFTGTVAVDTTFVYSDSTPFFGILGQNVAANVRIEYAITLIEEYVAPPNPWDDIPGINTWTFKVNDEHVAVGGIKATPVYIPPGQQDVHVKLTFEGTDENGDLQHTCYVNFASTGQGVQGPAPGFVNADLPPPTYDLVWRPGDDADLWVTLHLARSISTEGAAIKASFAGINKGAATGGFNFWIEVKTGEVNELPDPEDMPFHRLPYLLNLDEATLVHDLDIENIRMTDTGRAKDSETDPRGYVMCAVNDPDPTNAPCWRTRHSHGYTQTGNNESAIYTNTDVMDYAIEPHTTYQDSEGNWVLKLHADKFPESHREPNAANTRDYWYQGVILTTHRMPDWNHKFGCWVGEFTIPAQLGVWSAFWTIGIRPDTGASIWPPEVDFFEQFNGAWGAEYDQYDTSGTLHAGVHGSNIRNRAVGVGVKLNKIGFNDATNLFTQKHTWACVVTDEWVTWFIDGVEYNQERYILYPKDGNENYSYYTLFQNTVKVASNDVEFTDTSDFLVHEFKYYSNGWSFGDFEEEKPYELRGSALPSEGGDSGVVFIENGTTSWVVPDGVTEVDIECLGAGGSAISSTRSGGAGGAYSKSVAVAVTPGETLTVQVPATTAGTTGTSGTDCFVKREDTVLCLAKSANAPSSNSATAQGGQASGGTGDVKYSGGNAGSTSITGRSGGGGAAGPAGDGAAGGANVTSQTIGGGGGGANGGGAGVAGGTSAGTDGNGGTGPTGTAGGTSTSSAGNPGSQGSGGGGGNTGAGGANSHNAEWDATHGCGSGGGGARATGQNGGTGASSGAYGGGAGGNLNSGAPAPGGPGLIVMSYGDPWTIGDWTAGDDTTMSNAGAVFRGTATDFETNNPRLVREISGLTSGESYVAAIANRGGSSVGMQHYFRANSSDPGIGSGDLFQQISSIDDDVVNVEFIAPADGQVYVGCVGVVSGNGQYIDVEWVSFGLSA